MSETWVPEKILAISHGFMESRILLSGAELDLFTLLAPAPLTSVQITERTGYQTRALTVLLDALTAMGLIRKDNGHYQTDPSAAPLLTADSPVSVMPMLRHVVGLWRRWSHLTEIVSETGGVERQPGSYGDPRDLAAFIGAMHVVGQSVATRIAGAAKAGAARNLLDVGGGSGTYTMAFLEAYPELRATIFDQPPVVEMARERLAAAGLLDRVRLVAGDFYHDPLPAGHDLALLSAIIHQNSPAQNVELYRQIWAALVPGGRVLIRDHIMSPDKTSPRLGAFFAINMLVGTPGGSTYSLDEINDGLTAAGFVRIALLQHGERMDGLVEAFRPE